MTTSSLYPTHTIVCKVFQLSSHFQTQKQQQRPGRFFNALQRREPFGGSVKIKNGDAEQPFEHGEVIHYNLEGVLIHPVTTKIQVSFLTQLNERKETAQGFYHEAKCDFKPVTELNGFNRRKLRINNIAVTPQ